MCIAVYLSVNMVDENKISLLKQIKKELSCKESDYNDITILNNVAMINTDSSDISEKKLQFQTLKFLNLFIVFTGKIYNKIDIKTELLLKGYDFKTDFEEELLIKAYHYFGQDIILKLDGNFVFAIWDSDKETLLVARDRFGMKPLYYKLTDYECWFSSNLPILVKNTGDDIKINYAAIQSYFYMQSVVPSPDTLIEEYSKLDSGMYIVFSFSKDQKKILKKEVKYHMHSVLLNTKIEDEKDIIGKIKKMMINSIEKRILYNKNIINWLSGGLDSSLISAICYKELGIKLDSLSVGFDDINYNDGNEFEYSRYVSRLYSKEHQEILISNNQICDELYNSLDFLNEPMISNDYIGHYIMGKITSKQNIGMALSGLGADEVFYGYDWHLKYVNKKNLDISKLIMKTCFEYDVNAIKQFLNSEFLNININEDYLNRYHYDKNNSNFNNLVAFNLNIIMVEDPIKRANTVEMSNGIDILSPYLDNELVDYSLSVPNSIKLKNNIGKYILKKIALEYFVKDFVFRPKTHFEVPIIKYTEGKVKDMCKDILLSSKCINRGLYNKKFIDTLVNNKQEITNLGGNLLWELTVLEYWLSKII